MTTLDPSTGHPLPPDAIQRILFIAPSVHVYLPPPLTSTKGFHASTWTAPGTSYQISTCRLRIVETALPHSESVKTDVVLEVPETGELFAAAPYSGPLSVEQALDSSRFFALRVVGEGGQRATLGVGFEERGEAVDFGIALQEVRKVQGMGGGGVGRGGGKGFAAGKGVQQKDCSLKEGEMITVNIGGRGRRVRNQSNSTPSVSDHDALFSIKPPPPPSAVPAGKKAAAELGFDDGEFGEFV